MLRNSERDSLHGSIEVPADSDGLGSGHLLDVVEMVCRKKTGAAVKLVRRLTAERERERRERG